MQYTQMLPVMKDKVSLILRNVSNRLAHLKDFSHEVGKVFLSSILYLGFPLEPLEHYFTPTPWALQTRFQASPSTPIVLK